MEKKRNEFSIYLIRYILLDLPKNHLQTSKVVKKLKD